MAAVLWACRLRCDVCRGVEADVPALYGEETELPEGWKAFARPLVLPGGWSLQHVCPACAGTEFSDVMRTLADG